MFTMMNNARLAVGMQGVAIAEAATQKAIAYAKERTQGRAPGWSGDGMSPIIEHPDIARTLLTMKALTQGSRAIAYACAHAVDMAHAAQGEDARQWQERSSLLTPIAKAFATDAGVDVASMGIQVHGGMGFIEETGAARYLRDARIAPIYEGTNGIQAIDLVTRNCRFPMAHRCAASSPNSGRSPLPSPRRTGKASAKRPHGSMRRLRISKGRLTGCFRGCATESSPRRSPARPPINACSASC